MYKQSPSRSHRSKGIKGKHILQFCVLLVVSFWLIYQVKHSHDKKKEFEANDETLLEKMSTDGVVQRLGRKDLPGVTEIATDVEKHGEDEEDKESEEVGNTLSEDQPERGDASVSRDNESDEKDPEQEEDQADEVKDKEDSEGGSEENEGVSEENHDANEENEGGSEESHAENGENEGESEENNTENEEHESESKENRTENEENENAETEDHTEPEDNEDVGKEEHDKSDATPEDQDHDGGSTNTHEAQEELYKADDASSEVAHNVQTIIPETEKATTGHQTGLWGNINFGHENETKTSNEGNAGVTPRENEVKDNGTSSNGTVTEEKKYESNSAKSEDSSLQNSTLLSLSKDQLQNSSNSTAINGEHATVLLSRGTQTAASSNKTENVNTNNGVSLSSSGTKSASSNGTNGADAISAGEDSTLHQGQKSVNSGKAVSDETSEYQSSDKGTGTLQLDPIDASDTELDTLPEIRAEVQNSNNTVAE